MTDEVEIWHLSSDFGNLSSEDVLRNIIRDDRANYEKAESELNQYIELLDDSIALYIEPLQAAQRKVEEWKNDTSLRASMAMANSVLDYLLLARHSILLGYLSEVQGLLRGCHERITRCLLFAKDEDMAREFLSGAEIWQRDVNSRLENVLEPELVDNLRDRYRSVSRFVHPNLESFEFRTAYIEDIDLESRVGIYHRYGGLMSVFWGKAAIAQVVGLVLFVSNFLNGVVIEGTGKWGDDYEQIKARYLELLDEIKIQPSS